MHSGSYSSWSNQALVCQALTSRLEVGRTDLSPSTLFRIRHRQSLVLELASCVFLLPHYTPRGPPLSVCRDRSTRKFTGQSPASVVVTHETSGALELSSPRGKSVPSKLPTRHFAEVTSDSRIPDNKQRDDALAAEPSQWAWVKEELRSLVERFLDTRGMSATLSVHEEKTVSAFVNHLLSILQSCYPARYLSGMELTGNEIRSVILPYLDSLNQKHQKDVDILNKLPSVPGILDFDLASFVSQPGLTSKMLSEYPLLLEHLVDGKLPPSLSYCLSIGLHPSQVEATVRKFPPIVGYSFEGKIEKVVEFILNLDVSSTLIPRIVLKRPQLFGCNVEENLKPSANFLENLGVDRKRWGKILVSFPHMLTYSSSKSALVFKFLMDIGVSQAGAGKILSRFPHAVGYSVEYKLKPMVAYFEDMGIQDLGHMLTRSPQTLGLSLENNIKPTVEFLLSMGFSEEELALVLYRFPQILGLNIDQNLVPKWEFFKMMNRSTTELVDFPQYFGYSLENRIQPRYKVIIQRQLPWTLNRMLTTSAEMFKNLQMASRNFYGGGCSFGDWFYGACSSHNMDGAA